MNEYEWLLRPDGRVFNNLMIPDSEQGRRELANITGEALMDCAERAGGKIAIFDSKAQFYAFHETTVSKKHPGLGSRDLIQEIITAGQARGILYVAYVPIDCDARAFREHPEWRPLDASGTPLEDPIGWPRLCPNSGFGEFMADYARELASNYDIHGLWLDGMTLNATPTYCYCPWCREGFRAVSGEEAPTDPAADPVLWSRWIAYRHDAVKQLVARIRDAAREVKPSLPVLAGYLWHNAGQGTDTYLPECDLIWHEASWFWPPASLQYLRALHGRPPEHYIPANMYAPCYPVTYPEQELRMRAMEAIAHGGLPLFTLSGRPELLRPVNQELEARAEWLQDTQPVPHCGIVFSAASMYATDPSPYSEKSHYSSYGTLDALLQEKIPQSYLADKHLGSLEELSGFGAIILPDIGYISPRAARNLERYVAAGGGLVAFNRTSLFDHLGGERKDFLLADLLGVQFQGELSEYTDLPPWWGDIRSNIEFPNRQNMKFLALGDHPIVNDDIIRQSVAIEATLEFRRGKPADCPLVYFGDMLKVVPHPKSKVVLWEGVQDSGHGWPLITTREYGKGRVVYVAADLALQHLSLVSHRYLRRLIGNSVRYALGERKAPFEVCAPAHVQVTVFRQPAHERTILHLLNSPSPAGLPPHSREHWNGKFQTMVRPQVECVPVHDIKVRLLGHFRSVYLAPDRTPLPMTRDGEYTVVRVPRLDTHLMVVGEVYPAPANISLTL